MLCPRNLAALAAAAILCTGGYYLWDAVIISRSPIAPLPELFPNLMQTAVSALCYLALAALFDRIPALRHTLRARH